MASSGTLDHELAAAFRAGTLVKVVLSKGLQDAPKASVRPIELKGELHLQWAERRGKQEVHSNLTLEESTRRVAREFPDRYLQANLLTTEADFEFRADPRGKVTSRRGKPSTKQPVSIAHDAARNYLIPEGRPCPFLEAVGIMTPEGRVRAAMQHKFRQINRFLEFVSDIYQELPSEGTLRVVDFGCGKSYLTLAIHHLFTVIHGRHVDITGVDRTPDVVDTCRSVATRLTLEGLNFQIGDIGTADVAGPVHLAVALHACDTATDAALARAIEWQANVILAAPCCQHEVAARMQAPGFELLQTHGILNERLASLATDALRSAALEAAGYRTQVIEFIDLEHTPKNLLIRAVRRSQPDRKIEQQWIERFRGLKTSLGLSETAIDRILYAGESAPPTPDIQ